MLEESLNNIILSLLHSQHINKLRNKARSVLSASIDQFGNDRVSQAVPKEHQPLFKSVSKEKRKSEGRKANGASSVKQSSAGFDWAPSQQKNKGKSTSSKGFTISPGSTKRTNKQSIKATDQINLLDQTEMRNNLVPTNGEEQKPSAFTAKQMPISDDGRLIVSNDQNSNKRASTGAKPTVPKPKQTASTLNKNDEIKKPKQKEPSAKAKKKNKERKKNKEQVSAERFRKRKAGGDSQSEDVEPFAYWPMDAQLLNRRKGKAKKASENLASTTNVKKKARRS
jgi:hypothetical protein